MPSESGAVATAVSASYKSDGETWKRAVTVGEGKWGVPEGKYMRELCGRLGLCALFSHAEKTHNKRQDESSAARSSSPKQAKSLSANERRRRLPAHVVSSYSEAAVPQAIFCHPLFTFFSHSPISFSFFCYEPPIVPLVNGILIRLQMCHFYSSAAARRVKFSQSRSP